MMPQPSDLARVLAEADKLAAEIMRIDGTSSRGFAVAVVRAVVARLSDADAISLINNAKPPVDPRGMIG